MDRRQVLQTLAASLAAFTGSRCSGEDETPVVIPEGPQCEDPSAGGGRRIAVIGAGMAGLTAAHALTRCGFTVTVLESRGEVGGRHAAGDSDLGQQFEAARRCRGQQDDGTGHEAFTPGGRDGRPGS